jgi:hypothetical protein
VTQVDTHFLARMRGPWGFALMLAVVVGVLVVVWNDAFRFAWRPWHSNTAADVAAAVAATVARNDEGLASIRVLHRMSGGDDTLAIRREADTLLSVQRQTFTDDDLRAPGSFEQLERAALKVPDTYIKAYRATGERRYLEAAKDYVHRFLVFERAQWVHDGFLWNDHAIAERVYVVADIFDALARNGMVDDTFGKEVLDGIERWAYYLADPALYTFRTNHGVVQDLALMHASLMFPTLPGAAQYFQTARARSLDHLGYYVSDEGVVSEHSAGYHAYGVLLLGILQRYFVAHGDDIPQSIRTRYADALRFLARLRRSDGSLPLIGNTGGERVPDTVVGYDPQTKRLAAVALPRDTSACAWYPASGYAIWRDTADRDRSQLVIAWPRLPGVGHFRPMDFAVSFWSRDISWWTDTGYWGEDDPLLKRVRGWDGTNAPHFEGEAQSAQTRPRLVGLACANGVRFAELRRGAGAGGQIDRQVVQLAAEEWVVIDSWAGNATTFRERWTAGPEVQLSRVTDSHFEAHSRAATMRVVIAGSPGFRVQTLEGSLQPFAGWVWVDGRPRETPALFVDSVTRDGWVATYWTPRAGVLGVDLRWKSASDWSLAVHGAASSVSYARHASELMVGDMATAIEPAPAGAEGDDTMRASLAKAAARYPPPYRLLLAYRWKVTAAVAVAFALQFTLWLAVRRSSALAATVVLGGTALWVVSALWLTLRYFAA